MTQPRCQCGQWKSKRAETTERLKAEVEYLKEVEAVVIEAIETLDLAEFVLEEASKVPGFTETGGLA